MFISYCGSYILPLFVHHRNLKSQLAHSLEVLILYFQMWLNFTKMHDLMMCFLFDGKSSIIIDCFKVGSTLKLARRRMESGQYRLHQFIYAKALFCVTTVPNVTFMLSQTALKFVNDSALVMQNQFFCPSKRNCSFSLFAYNSRDG